ncbi:MAG: PadR family transcriptional regulator [Muribaculaceae bacterium]|nr:PadR family transcriptional regulator [Muribaculaceae bacterium]
MNIDNLKSQMRKGMLEFCVLLLLRGRDAYASEIIARMKEARLIVMEGTLYPLLTRLKNDGLLTYRWEESPSGPPRKYYSITETGRSFLRQLQESWEEISHAVNHLNHEPFMPPAISEQVADSSEEESTIEVVAVEIDEKLD